MGTVGGGDGAGQLAVSYEFDDYASYGKFMDTLLAAPQTVAGLMAIGTDKSAIASVQSSVWSVIEELTPAASSSSTGTTRVAGIAVTASRGPTQRKISTP